VAQVTYLSNLTLRALAWSGKSKCRSFFGHSELKSTNLPSQKTIQMPRIQGHEANVSKEARFTGQQNSKQRELFCSGQWLSGLLLWKMSELTLCFSSSYNLQTCLEGKE